LVLLAALTMAWPQESQAQNCIGDCNGDGGVFINELISGVNIALGQPFGVCEGFDGNGDGEVSIVELIQAVNHALEGCPGVLAVVELPRHGVVVQAGTVAARVVLPPGTDLNSVVARIDNVDVTEELVGFGVVEGELKDVTPGRHGFIVDAMVNGELRRARSVFDAIALNHPEECEVLNQAECLLPYPSSRFLVRDPLTRTGYRLNIPARGIPDPNGPPIPPDPLNKLDGFNPMAQILMHFPQGVDLEASNASRLLAPGCCGQPAGPPWINTRTYDGRSLETDSPSVLLDATTGERVLHWLELDGHADGMAARQALIMRPGLSLVPGHRYIVAMRNLKAPGGADVVAEPAFMLFRDGRPTDIEPIESRRPDMELMFDDLEAAGVNRAELVLAFDFVVQSEEQLTAAMLSMRDAAFAWLDEVQANDEITFTVTNVQDNDCEAPGAVVWRNVSGTYKSPLFLTLDPNQPGVGFLNVDEGGMPVQNGFTDANFSISIPCSILPMDTPVLHAIVLGHGLFGAGSDMTTGIPPRASQVVPWNFIAGATDWRGLARQDAGWVVGDIVGVGETKLYNFPALPDRLKQGMLNTLVLARMMRHGLFNLDTDHFQTPGGKPVFSDREMFYYGISLGGIMGTWFAALTPDVQRFGLDVPAINFACLLQRSTQFGRFQDLLVSTGLTDPMQTILGIGLNQELWAAGEPSGYARHITSDPLPGSGDPKRILMTPAWLDKQVSNQCTEIAARTLQLPNLVPASLQRELQGIPDREGPLDSAYVMYDTGAFDLFDPAHQPFIPPLSNVIPSDVCDPHGDRPRIPDGIRMLVNFLQPDGQVANFCTDICDAGEPEEIRDGASEPCSPPQ
jgi:hypothetical protein